MEGLHAICLRESTIKSESRGNPALSTVFERTEDDGAVKRFSNESPLALRTLNFSLLLLPQTATAVCS